MPPDPPRGIGKIDKSRPFNRAAFTVIGNAIFYLLADLQSFGSRCRHFGGKNIQDTIAIGLLFNTFILLLPFMGYKCLSVYYSMLCSFVLFLVSVAFVLSFRQALALFIQSVIIMAVFLTTGNIRPGFFFILILLNAGAFFISQKIAGDFIKSATEEVSTTERLKNEANTDFLTQLLNRNGMEQALETAWAFCKRYQKSIGFIMADIDFFKSYNDTLGHIEGDNILKQVADSIKTCCKRETDIIGRVGGEEFLIVLSDIDDKRITEMAQAVSLAVNSLRIKATETSNHSEFLSVSIGISTAIPQDHILAIDLYRKADFAMYHAKSSGRNCISFNGNIVKTCENIVAQEPVKEVIL